MVAGYEIHTYEKCGGEESSSQQPVFRLWGSGAVGGAIRECNLFLGLRAFLGGGYIFGAVLYFPLFRGYGAASWGPVHDFGCGLWFYKIFHLLCMWRRSF